MQCDRHIYSGAYTSNVKICIPVFLVTLLIAVNSYACKTVHSSMSTYIHRDSCMTDTDTHPFLPIYIPRYIHVSLSAYTYIITWKHTCLHLCMSGYIHACMHTHYIHTHSCLSAYIQTYKHAYKIYVYIDTYVYIYNVQSWMCIHELIHILIFMYVCLQV